LSYRRADIMIDCGLDWLGKFERLQPNAIVLTHAHPDHASGLRRGASCPVVATQETWETLRSWPIREWRLIKARKPTNIYGVLFEAFSVEHSLIAPAVAYRISAGCACIFYAPDLIFIHDRAAALKKVQLYIGDGSTLTSLFVRKRGDRLIGHTSARAQIGWCGKSGVRRVIISHCGSEIVTGNEQQILTDLRNIGSDRAVEVSIAFDGMKLIVP
jgi:phosphoribosyl 1,2-cyclic phosphodiesterase